MMRMFVVAAIATLSFSTAAHAETENCTEITALPFTITTQGIYCLKQNLNLSLATGNAITVNAGNVAIDFNGWRVNNQAAVNTSVGVFAQDRKNISLRDGFIRGFHRGIYIAQTIAGSSEGHLVTGMKIAETNFVGIIMQGDKSVVSGNRILQVGPQTSATGIELSFCRDCNASDNVISNVTGNGTSAQGIFISSSSRVISTRNTIFSIDDATSASGIRLNFSSAVVLAENEMLNAAGVGHAGVLDVNASTNVSCLDNDLGGFGAAPLTGCDVDNGNRILFN